MVVLTDGADALSKDIAEALQALEPVVSPTSLGLTFMVLEGTFETALKARLNKRQLLVLIQTATKVLDSLSKIAGISPDTTTRYGDIVESISDFAQRQLFDHILKSVFAYHEAAESIRRWNGDLKALASSLGIEITGAEGEDVKALAEAARQDGEAMQLLLNRMGARTDVLEEELDLSSQSERTIMQAIQIGTRTMGSETPASILSSLSRILNVLSRRSGTPPPPIDSSTMTSFELEKGPRIGEGGFSVVYKGSWRGTPVAIKEFDEKTSEKLVMREVKIWAALRHPHVIPLFGASIYERPPFVIMPLMQCDAVSYCESARTVDRLRIAHEAAMGLDYLHSRDICHGDLKALNVLVDSTGSVKLADFGLARLKAAMTTTGGRRGPTGSLRWMAPEVLIGGRLDFPVDLFAMGMFLWELETLEVPLGMVDDGQLIVLVCDRKVRPERPTTLSEDDPLWKLMQSCWTGDPAGRPSAGAVVRKLAEIRSGRGEFVPMQKAPPRSTSSGAAGPSAGAGAGSVPSSSPAPTMTNTSSPSLRSDTVQDFHVIDPSAAGVNQQRLVASPPTYATQAIGGEATVEDPPATATVTVPPPEYLTRAVPAEQGSSSAPIPPEKDDFGRRGSGPSPTASGSASVSSLGPARQASTSRSVQSASTSSMANFSAQSPTESTAAPAGVDVAGLSLQPAYSVGSVGSAARPSAPDPIFGASLEAVCAIAATDLLAEHRGSFSGPIPIVVSKLTAFVGRDLYRAVSKKTTATTRRDISAALFRGENAPGPGSFFFASKSRSAFQSLGSAFVNASWAPQADFLRSIFSSGPTYGRDVVLPMRDAATGKKTVTAIDGAVVLLRFLRALPEPVVPLDAYDWFVQAAHEKKSSRSKTAMKDVFWSALPPPNRTTFIALSKLIEDLGANAVDPAEGREQLVGTIFQPVMLRSRDPRPGFQALATARRTLIRFVDFRKELVKQQ